MWSGERLRRSEIDAKRGHEGPCPSIGKAVGDDLFYQPAENHGSLCECFLQYSLPC